MSNALLVYSPQVLKAIFTENDAVAAKILYDELRQLPGLGPRRLEAIFGNGEPTGAHLTGFALMITGMRADPDSWCKDMRKLSKEKISWGYPSAPGLYQQYQSPPALVPASWTRESATTLLAWVRSYEDASREYLASKNLL